MRRSHLISDVKGMDEASFRREKRTCQLLGACCVSLLRILRAVIIVSRIGDSSVGKSLLHLFANCTFIGENGWMEVGKLGKLRKL